MGDDSGTVVAKVQLRTVGRRADHRTSPGMEAVVMFRRLLSYLALVSCLLAVGCCVDVFDPDCDRRCSRHCDCDCGCDCDVRICVDDCDCCDCCYYY